MFQSCRLSRKRETSNRKHPIVFPILQQNRDVASRRAARRRGAFQAPAASGRPPAAGSRRSFSSQRVAFTRRCTTQSAPERTCRVDLREDFGLRRQFPVCRRWRGRGSTAPPGTPRRPRYCSEQNRGASTGRSFVVRRTLTVVVCGHIVVLSSKSWEQFNSTVIRTRQNV